MKQQLASSAEPLDGATAFIGRREFVSLRKITALHSPRRAPVPPAGQARIRADDLRYCEMLVT